MAQRLDHGRRVFLQARIIGRRGNIAAKKRFYLYCTFVRKGETWRSPLTVLIPVSGRATANAYSSIGVEAPLTSLHRCLASWLALKRAAHLFAIKRRKTGGN